MHFVDYQFCRKEVMSVFGKLELYTQRNITIGFKQREMVSIFGRIFVKLNTPCLGIWSCTFFFYILNYINTWKYYVTLENITNKFLLDYTHASHNYSHIFNMFSLCRCLLTCLYCRVHLLSYSNWFNCFSNVSPMFRVSIYP